MSGRLFLAAALVVAALQTMAIGAMIGGRIQLINNGREVVLRSGMVDPRDLFRGHYVTLNLDVGDLTRSSVGIDREFSSGETVYVELRSGEGEDPFWRAARLWHEIPDDGEGPYLRGEIAFAASEPDQSYRIAFPFDRYFAEKNRAKDLEDVRNRRQLGVVMALAEDGRGQITGLTLDGRKIYDEPLW